MRRIVLLASIGLCGLLAGPARATWSIVVTDSKTGEIAVGTATCIGGGDIQLIVPVMRVGWGAAAHQANVTANQKNKKTSWAELAKGTDPAVILALTQAGDTGFNSRQIGIVDLLGRSVSYSGNGNGAWAGGVSGAQGTLTYAIQGNVLTGAPVVLEAEKALLLTPGDMAAKLMAAMEAARAYGGDGRCSCSQSNPTGCGSPPPSFAKSALIATMVLARIGDAEGICTEPAGCANGSYYLDLNVSGNQSGLPDPVVQLQSQFAAWRTGWTGRPDHLRSKVTLGGSTLPADGVSNGMLTIEAIDWQGTPVGHGGATVSVSLEHASDDVVTLGAVTDHGNGSYTMPYVAKTALGVAELRVAIDDGMGKVTLYPFTHIATARPDFLTTNAVTQISASQGDDVPLLLDAGAGVAGRSYLVLLSNSGSVPGLDIGALHVGINPDPVLVASILLCNGFSLPNTCGVFDGAGTAQASLTVQPHDLLGFVSSTLTFAAITTGPEDFASTPVTVSVLP